MSAPKSAARVAVVSGGATGIGYAIVERLLADGAKVAFFARTEESVAGAIRLLGDSPNILGKVADVTEPRSVADVFEAVRTLWGPVGILIANAGISPKRRSPAPWITQIDVAEWNRVIEINLTGAYVCVAEAARDMIALGWGRIVTIGSLAGRTTPKKAGPHYAASKAGLAGLTRALAQDLAPHGITVNCIAPDWVASAMTAPADSEVAREAAKAIPLGRVGVPGDIAGVISFLVSKDAGYITGATLDVNGGTFTA